MVLVFHIVFSSLGIIGAYISSFGVLRAHSTKNIHTGMWLSIIGLVGVIVSGSMLFANNPQTFLTSGKFVSNMMILLILVIVEILFLVNKNKTKAFTNRYVSASSWTWIFVIAVINPAYGYILLFSAYLLVLFLGFCLLQVTLR